jgi:hypothetical protein
MAPFFPQRRYFKRDPWIYALLLQSGWSENHSIYRSCRVREATFFPVTIMATCILIS